MRTVTIGGEERRVEPFSARKVNRALRLLRQIASDVPDLLKVRGRFVAEYEQEHYTEISRAEALRRYGVPSPVLDPETRQPIRGDDGQIVTVPSGILQMTEEAWAAVGHKYRVPESPSFGEEMWAIFPHVLDRAEETVVQLLALVLMRNEDVAAWSRDGSLNDEHKPDGSLKKRGKLHEAAQDLLDEAMGDELLEVAVVAGEVVDEQLMSKARRLMEAGRLGNVVRLFGIDPERLKAAREKPAEQPTSNGNGATTSTTPEQTPSSSTDSPEASQDSAPEPSSTTSPGT